MNMRTTLYGSYASPFYPSFLVFSFPWMMVPGNHERVLSVEHRVGGTSNYEGREA